MHRPTMQRAARDTESPMPSYDPNNMFAKILRGELPAHKVYEDDKASPFSTSCRERRAIRW